LVGLLKADNPKERTISATILGKRRNENAIIPLSLALKREKALYSRIAMSEALSKIGEPAIGPLVGLLGEIGKNQETELPQKYFNKKSYPLVRDMAARTLVKIGKPATPYLIEVIENGADFKVQQAIDAIGGIAAETGYKRALKVLINRLERSIDNGDKITLWKIVRALSGFSNSEETVGPLTSLIVSDHHPPIVWEALRSLGQLRVKTPEIIELVKGLTESGNTEISKSARNALINLEKL
jgi:HEAT repeat protein